MPNKKPKRPRDTNTLSWQLVQEATGQAPKQAVYETEPAKRGRKGGKKGGPARARKLSKQRRSEIAKKAADARWKKDR